MPSPMLMLAVVVAFVLNGFYWNAHGHNAEATAWKAKTEKQLADAESAARKQEAMWQGVVNETAKNYQARERGIRGNLDIALDSLRARPGRSDVSGAARANCAGGSGTELSGPDGEFLSREAARAESIRGGLTDCYRVLDALK